MHEKINFDRQYTMGISQMKIKDFSFGGYTTTTIAKDNVTDRWKIQMVNEPKKFAITNGTLPPFGTRDYHLSDALGGGNITLNINACADETEYNCDDGTCIPIKDRCDSKFDCMDRSDESACHMIAVPTSYIRHVPAGKTFLNVYNFNIKCLY